MSKGEDGELSLEEIQEVLRRLQNLPAAPDAPRADPSPPDPPPPTGRSAGSDTLRAIAPLPSAPAAEKVPQAATPRREPVPDLARFDRPQRRPAEAAQAQAGAPQDLPRIARPSDPPSPPRQAAGRRTLTVAGVLVAGAGLSVAGLFMAGAFDGLSPKAPEPSKAAEATASPAPLALAGRSAGPPPLPEVARPRVADAGRSEAESTPDFPTSAAPDAVVRRDDAHGRTDPGETSPKRAADPFTAPGEGATPATGPASVAAAPAPVPPAPVPPAPAVAPDRTDKPTTATGTPPEPWAGPLVAPPTIALRPKVEARANATPQSPPDGPSAVDGRTDRGAPPSEPPPAATVKTDKRLAAQNAGAPCNELDVAVEARDGGTMGLKVKSRCRAGEGFEVIYDKIARVVRFDDAGDSFQLLDLFLGGKSVVLSFEDGTRRTIPAKANDLDRMIKVALVWTAPVNLDLHALENGAPFGGTGHVWEKAPSSYAEAVQRATADGRGHGFMSSTANAATEGTHIEVYTVVRPNERAAVSVTMALDFETRAGGSADACGAGRFSTVDYDLYVLGPKGQMSSVHGTIDQQPCDVRQDPSQRYQRAAMPALNFEPQ